MRQGIWVTLLVLTFAAPAGAQEYYRVICNGMLYGAGVNIHGVYANDAYGIEDREVAFRGQIRSNYYGNWELKFHDYNNPFEGVIVSPQGMIPVRVWEQLDTRTLSGTWEIQENYPNTFKAQRYVGKLFCRAVG